MIGVQRMGEPQKIRNAAKLQQVHVPVKRQQGEQPDQRVGGQKAHKSSQPPWRQYPLYATNPAD